MSKSQDRFKGIGKGQPDKVAPSVLRGVPDEAKEILESLPKQQRATLELAIMKTTISHSGPLPNPESYARYEEILPGAADRILSMTERQQLHRIELEKMAISRQLNQSSTGQWLAAILAAFLIGAGSFLIYTDHDLAGGGIITGTLVSLVVAFVKGKDAQKQDLKGNNIKKVS